MSCGRRDKWRFGILGLRYTLYVIRRDRLAPCLERSETRALVTWYRPTTGRHGLRTGSKTPGGAGDTVPECWGGRFGSTSVSKNRLWSSRFQIPRLAPDFGELDSFQKPAQAIQNPDSAPRRGFWNLDRFQDPDIAMQNPDYAPRPAIWKLKDKIQIPNSETAVSVYAPVL